MRDEIYCCLFIYNFKGKVLQVGKAAKFGGKTKGRLIGGNLTVLTSLLGTPWQPDFRGCVLFLEDGTSSLMY